MKNLKIGSFVFPYGLVLAPMAGVTDRAFRQVCRKYGAELLVSEMISAKAIHFHDTKTYELARFQEKERPISIQLFGSEPEIMAEAAIFLQNSKFSPDIIDINMGCPVRKIVSNGEGCALMQDPSLAAKIVYAIKKSVSLPVTVKCRIGFDSNHKNILMFSQAVEAAGADAICIHGRTREQMYSPPIDYDAIAQAKKHLSIPVIANGGINTVDDAKKMFENTNCDGIALARGTYGNPFLFSQIIDYFEGRESIPVSLNEKLKTAKWHFDLLRQEKGDTIAIKEGRRQISWYFQGINGATSIRKEFFSAQSIWDYEIIFEKISSIVKERKDA